MEKNTSTEEKPPVKKIYENANKNDIGVSFERTKKLIEALNSAILAIQTVHTREEVFRAVAGELKKMEIESMVLMVDDERKNLFFEYYSYDSNLIKIAEKIAGMTSKELLLKIDKVKEYEEVINNKKTLLISSSVDFIRQILPEKLKFMAEQLKKIFKISRFIIAPLIIEEKVFGIFSVQSDDIEESDIPEVTIFAHHLAGVWHKGDLLEKAQCEIKERKEAEDALKKSEERFSKAFHSSPIAISISEQESGKYIDINEKFLKLIGYNREDVIGKNSIELNLWIDDSGRKKVSDELKRNGFIKDIVTDFKNKSGQIRTWKSSLELIELNGKLCILSLIDDITDEKKALESLKQSEERFSKTFSLSPYTIGVSELESGKYIDVNENFIKLTGFKKEEVLGKSASNLNIYLDTNLRNRIYNQLIKEGSIRDLQTEIRTKSGEIKTVNASMEIMELKEKPCILVMADDITERKKAEEKLRENDRKTNTLINNLPGVVYRCLNDDSWTMEYLSEGIFRLTGYPASDFIKNNVRTFDSIIETDDRTLLRETVQAGLINRKPFTVEYKIKTATGQIKWVWERGVGITENGEIVALEGYITDITERKKADEENILLAQTVRSVRDAISLTDMNNKIIYINEAFLDTYGYTEKEILGKNISILSPQRFSEISKSIHEETLKNSWHGEIINKRKDGREFPIELWTSVVRDSSNNILATVGVARDVTERKTSEDELIKAKEKAEEMSKVKSSFLANMSHEVRTPLVAILGFSEVLEEIVKDPQIKNYVEMIHAGGVRLLDTLNLILDLSVIESQKVNVKFKPVDIVKEVKEAIALFEKFADKKKLKLNMNSVFECMVFDTDEKILRQIMNNLINNAIKYTDNGSITVSLDKELRYNKSYISMRVEDTGIGIPKDKQELIWDEFRQVSEGLNRSFEGAGLGLSITKKFVEKIGGEIVLEKSEVDIGSVFKVLFPVEGKVLTEAKYSKLSDENIIGFNEKEKKNSKPQILYIDDDTISLDIVKAFAKDVCDIDTSLTGMEGIEKSKKKIYDAVLMDINLGQDMDGLQATKMLRELKEYKHVPVVAVTAYAMVGDKENFFKSGCTHYLSKPFNKKELIEMLKEVLKPGK